MKTVTIQQAKNGYMLFEGHETVFHDTEVFTDWNKLIARLGELISLNKDRLGFEDGRVTGGKGGYALQNE